MSTNRIIVFGGGTVFDDRGCVRLHSASIERAERTIDYYNVNKALFVEKSLARDAFILCTGGFGLLSAGVEELGANEREAVLMADYLTTKGGIPIEIILLEKESISTVTNWTRSLELYSNILKESLFDEKSPLGLVSHPHHLKRVIYLAKKLGYNRDVLEEIPTVQEDNKNYESKVLAVYKKYLKNVRTPSEMEEKEREIAKNSEVMRYLRNQS